MSNATVDLYEAAARAMVMGDRFTAQELEWAADVSCEVDDLTPPVVNESGYTRKRLTQEDWDNGHVHITFPGPPVDQCSVCGAMPNIRCCEFGREA